jgi:hypothetical protein
MSTSLLGYDMSSPIILAPTGAQKLANPEGTKTRSLMSLMKFKMIKYVIDGLVLSLNIG